MTKDDQVWRITAYQRVDRLPLVVDVASVGAGSADQLAAHHLLAESVGVAILMAAAMTAYALHRQLQGRMRAHAQLSDTVRALEQARLAAEEAQPRQEPVHGEYEPRAAHAAQRGDRL